MQDYIRSLLPIENYETGLVIFTRDLRIQDNYTIEVAGKSCNKLTGCFIFNPKQIDPKKNAYYNHNAIQFMMDSIMDMPIPLALLSEIPNPDKYQCIFISSDYTKFAKLRELELEKFAKKHKLNLVMVDNHLLEPPTKTQPYQKYTPYYNSRSYTPIIVKSERFKSKFIKLLSNFKPNFEKVKLDIKGGRKRFNAKDFSSYEKTRNDPNIPTTRMGAYIKFGCISVREAYKLFEKNTGIIKQLWWREFYYNLAIGFPHILEGASLKEKYDKIHWENDSGKIKAWKEGKTGFQFVDAGMMQLNNTGFMHNRLRLVTANFLIKDLHVDWRIGEKYFAQHLIDYDPIVNNGNWQWCSGGGADSQPYFRIFNPELQMKTYDPQELFIKKYLNYFGKKIIDHDKEKIITMKYYKIALA